MPAFAYWPNTITSQSTSSEVVSTMDILPSLLKLAKINVPANNVIIDGRDSLADIILGTGGSKHDFLPFYNGYYGNVSKEIYAARAGRYKAHWITAPGLGGGRWPTDAHAAPETMRHDPPLIFDVEADPAETFPLQHDEVRDLNGDTRCSCGHWRLLVRCEACESNCMLWRCPVF